MLRKWEEGQEHKRKKKEEIMINLLKEQIEQSMNELRNEIKSAYQPQVGNFWMEQTPRNYPMYTSQNYM